MFGIAICLINNVREDALDFAKEIENFARRLGDRALQLEDAECLHTSGSKPFVRLPLTCPKEMDGLDCDDRTRGR